MSVLGDRAEIAEISNAVLDDLAGGEKSPLYGPSRLKMLQAAGDWQKYSVYLEDPSPLLTSA